VKIEKMNHELSEEKLDHDDDAQTSALFIDQQQTKLDKKDDEIERLQALLAEQEVDT